MESRKKLDVFLNHQNTPGISGIDTRYLTRKLSKNGAEKVALIHFGDNKHDFQNLQKNLAEWGGLENLDLASLVSTKNNLHGMKVYGRNQINKILTKIFQLFVWILELSIIF